MKHFQPMVYEGSCRKGHRLLKKNLDCTLTKDEGEIEGKLVNVNVEDRANISDAQCCQSDTH